MKKPATENEAELIRRAMAVLGSRTSEKKKKSSTANSARSRFKPRPLSELRCTCGRGDVLEGHPTTCPKGRAIRRRLAAGQPLEAEATST